MIYTYYFGVMCAGKNCRKYISIDSYQTNVRARMTDTDLGDGFPLTCPYCNFRHGYHTHDLRYSQDKDEMVPLDQ